MINQAARPSLPAEAIYTARNQLVYEADKWRGGEGASSLNGMRTEPPAPQETLSASSAKRTQC